jgi:hypothetical protein
MAGGPSSGNKKKDHLFLKEKILFNRSLMSDALSHNYAMQPDQLCAWLQAKKRSPY